MSNFPFQYFDNISLSVIVPVYNEGSNIQGNLKLLQEEVSRYFKDYEIIVVSDGSTDETNINVKKLENEHLRLIAFEKNKGKGAAVHRGFTEAKGDFLLFIDGGMELHPREIKIFLGLMYLYDADIVIGSKRHPQSNVHYPWYRRILSYLFQTAVRILFHIRVTDTQVGIKMFRKSVICAVLPHLQVTSYGFDLEILGFAARLGFRNILEAPVRLDYFLKNNKGTLRDVIHTMRIGLALLKDVYKLWLRMRKLPASKTS